MLGLHRTESDKVSRPMPGRQHHRESSMKAGDVLAFGGTDAVSVAISLLTFGVPFRSAAHVGIVAEVGGELRLFESTADAADECVVTGTNRSGVKATDITKRVDWYLGRVWHYPLSRPLYDHERGRLTEFLCEQLGKPYDTAGAVKAGGYLLAKVKAKHDDTNEDRFFCSELVAAAHSTVGLFATCNAGRWSPNSLLRTEHMAGIVGHPRRIK